MVVCMYIQRLIYLMLSLANVEGFIPHPLLAYGALTSTSVTHTEITGHGFIRSLARFFYDARMHSNNKNVSIITEENYLTTEHTIDDLYKFAHPEYNQAQVSLYSLPLKFILDTVMTHNALVDFDASTKKLSAAHFDSEAFINGSRRILRLRQTIVNDTRTIGKDLSDTRELLGQLLHTLQDFYSHSNRVEMGKTDVNDLIGVSETIGLVAGLNQATCTDIGCTKLEKTCTLWQQITLGVCPLVYYDCQNNILPDINSQQLLTSGYVFNQFNEDNQPINKPTNIGKCSHGSVLDDSSHIPAVGGINKDSYSLLFSPHSNLHKQAVDLAVKATERFFNDLRRDVGDHNFDRLFAIHPNGAQCQLASDSVSQGKRFRFFSPYLSASLKDDNRLLRKLKRLFKKLFKLIKSILTGRLFRERKINQPTYDLSDKGVNVKDVNNFRAAPYILGKEELKRKKRMVNL